VAANPFSAARRYLTATPLPTWGAVLASVGSVFAVALLLPVVYLFVDLLVWRGAMPAYAGLPPAWQKHLRDEWKLPDDADPAACEQRLREATYSALLEKAGSDAAAAYLTVPEGGTPAAGVPTGKRLGVLSLLARERPRWTASLLGGFARWNRWAWDPDPVTGLNTAYLAGLFVIAFALTVLLVVLLFLSEFLSAVAALDAVGRMRRAVFAHANRIGLLAVRQQAAAEAADLFTRKTEQVQDGLRAWLLYGVRAPLLAAVVLVLLLAVHFWLTAAVLLLGAIVWLVGGQFAAWFRRDARLAARRSEARLAQMRESLTILHLVKMYLMERFNQTRVERQLADQGRAEWRRLRGEALSRPALVAAVTLAAIALLYLAGRAVLVGEMSVAALAMKVAGVVALVSAVSVWLATRVKVARAAGAAAAVSEFLDRRADPGQPIDAEFLQPMNRKLDLVEVSLREPGTGRMLLENVTLSIPTGTRLAVVGSDPVEVETFAHVLTRFADPTGGEVRIDGKNTRWVTHESLRTQVAMVSRRNLVFTDTVANNIGCGDGGFSIPQIIEAAKVAHAHGFVQRLPYGYETLIGDAGYALRPGEQLRIAMARAILRDPSVIVIEEPEAALDDDSRALLDDTFARIRPGRTLVFLSRRQAVLQAADKVVVLHRGRIAAAGTHNELLGSNDLYRQMLFQTAAAPATA
jgi:ATP-binding cassette subfamily B protein